MTVYVVLILFVLLNGITAQKHKKAYVISTFFILFLAMALRKETIGIDLELHYAKNFVRIANADWGELTDFIGIGGYDYGYVIFCKLVSCISSEVQFYIAVTSAIVCGLVGRYIYRQSDDVVLESFLYVSCFLYFMYMSIIAQSIAVALVLWGVDELAQKKNIKFVILVALASAIHSSAIICFVFWLLMKLPIGKKNLVCFTIGIVILFLLLPRTYTFIVNNFLPQFSFYLSGTNKHGQAVGLSTFNICLIVTYTIGLVVLILFNRLKPLDFSTDQGFESEVLISRISTNFLVYMSISSIAIRLLAADVEVVARIGYYIYLFSYSLAAREVQMLGIYNKKCMKIIIYFFVLAFFLLFCPRAGQKSYGVYPYVFFWQ